MLLRVIGKMTALTLPRRAYAPTLLTAAAAAELRAGAARGSEGAFLVKPGFQVVLAATFFANELG